MHRGVLALRIGDLPAALLCFDQAAERFDRLGTPDPSLSIERCAALLAAGLPQDALAEAHTALARLERIRGLPVKKAELLLTAANCALAAAGPPTRSATPPTPPTLRPPAPPLVAGARPPGRRRAQLAAGTTDAACCGRPRSAPANWPASPRPTCRSATSSPAASPSPWATPPRATGHLATAARGRRHGPALSRAAAWLAEALRAEAGHDAAG